jgi:hypothetical protein
LDSAADKTDKYLTPAERMRKRLYESSALNTLIAIADGSIEVSPQQERAIHKIVDKSIATPKSVEHRHTVSYVDDDREALERRARELGIDPALLFDDPRVIEHQPDDES